MSTLFPVILSVLLIIIVVQAVLVLGFARTLCKKPVELLSDDQAPPALVILCLRGTDPFLEDCLDGLLNQDYPDFDIRVVIDHPEDPAHEVVSAKLKSRGASRAKIEFLEEKRTTCSLKCSSLVQVASRLDPRYELMAQLDADTVAHPTWLRELATALADEKVGAATGNRWYMPHNPSVGALVRYGWNAAAIVQMYWYEIAWGGTLAVKTRVLRETDVLERWGNAFCEDTMMFAVLKEVGMKVRFVPTLMMINREDCTLGGFFRWVSRQLLTAKLYHPAWPAVLGHAIVTTLAPAVALATFVYASLQGNHTAAAGLAAGLVGYELSLALLLLPMEAAVRRIAESRGQPGRWLFFMGAMKFLSIMPLTQIVYPTALAAACWMRATRWRGIDYRIDGPWQIKMQAYRPYQPPEREAGQSTSL
ncbi:MAG: glycosyltransferase family 2 protein [Pirellulales bacterium]|nr:glycosyltransferase family 2 protein [Pirellulales bacterium]